ncbi:methyltransf_25 domain-containing protein [Caerostris extrusa]|uniref:Methyltransf_25 domain-containing protein n=1 Tax=Caerostris extrusa TaxID=172846 RepID=A0AAV4W4L4_CAEEX|nr:methyltransf_25 domain-containing protein [Caerostris extrusa]
MNLDLDSDLYVKSHVPSESVIHFLEKTLPQLGWIRRDEDVVMDVGCGPGRVTIDLILPVFPRLKKLLAIDLLSSMVNIARKHNPHPIVQYEVADIEDWSTMDHWEGQMTKVKNPKWCHFFNEIDTVVPDSHCKQHDALYYKEILAKIGFEILHLKEENITDVLPSDEDYITTCVRRTPSVSVVPERLFTSVCVLVPHVPMDRRDEFQEDLFQEILQLNGRDSNGLPFHAGKIIELVVKKN